MSQIFCPADHEVIETHVGVYFNYSKTIRHEAQLNQKFEYDIFLGINKEVHHGYISLSVHCFAEYYWPLKSSGYLFQKVPTYDKFYAIFGAY